MSQKNFYLFFCFIAIFLSSFVLALEVANAADAYWSFDECAATDDSGNAYTGTVHGSPECVDGAVNKAFQFDNITEYIVIPKQLSPSISAFSFSVWIHPTDIINDVFQREVIALAYDAGGQADVQCHHGACFFAMKLTNAQIFYVYNTVLPNIWTHLVGTYERGNQITLWLNGVKKTDARIPGFDLFSATPADVSSIGNLQILGEPRMNWEGLIDEVRVYEHALSESEIKALYNEGCTDNDSDGYSSKGGGCGPIDCNDDDASVHPGANEACNGQDDDCDGQTDEDVTTTYYKDADGDGYGNYASTAQACSPPAGYVSNNNDCNDNNSSIHPGAVETCNGKDDNCNSLVDEGVTTAYYWDEDGDGYGNSAVTLNACSAPAGYVVVSGDCDDSNPAIHDNCTCVDNDGDGYGEGPGCIGPDINDDDPTVQSCSVVFTPSTVNKLFGSIKSFASFIIRGDKNTSFSRKTEIKWGADSIKTLFKLPFGTKNLFVLEHFSKYCSLH